MPAETPTNANRGDDDRDEDNRESCSKWPVKSRSELTVNDAPECETGLTAHHLRREEVANGKDENKACRGDSAWQTQWQGDAPEGLCTTGSQIRRSLAKGLRNSLQRQKDRQNREWDKQHGESEQHGIEIEDEKHGRLIDNT